MAVVDAHGVVKNALETLYVAVPGLTRMMASCSISIGEPGEFTPDEPHYTDRAGQLWLNPHRLEWDEDTPYGQCVAEAASVLLIGMYRVLFDVDTMVEGAPTPSARDVFDKAGSASATSVVVATAPKGNPNLRFPLPEGAYTCQTFCHWDDEFVPPKQRPDEGVHPLRRWTYVHDDFFPSRLVTKMYPKPARKVAWYRKMVRQGVFAHRKVDEKYPDEPNIQSARIDTDTGDDEGAGGKPNRRSRAAREAKKRKEHLARVRIQVTRTCAGLPRTVREWASEQRSAGKKTETLPPTFRLKKELIQFINGVSDDSGRSYKRPNKRMAQVERDTGLLFPRRWGNKYILYIALDVSYSMSFEQIERGIDFIRNVANNRGFRVKYFSAADGTGVVREAIPGKPLGFDIRGGCGTDLRKAFDLFVGANAKNCIILSDLMTPWPDAKPDPTASYLAVELTGLDRPRLNEHGWIRYSTVPVPDWLPVVQMPVNQL